MDPTSELMTDAVLATTGVTARSLSQSQRQALEESGYLVIPGVVGAKFLVRLRQAFDDACESEEIPPTGTRHPIGLLACDPGFHAFITHPTVLAAVHHVLNRPFRFTGGAGRDPMPGFGLQGLHMDCVDPGPSAPFQVVTALGLIDDLTRDNGSTRLVPGSHRARRPPPKSMSNPASSHPDQIVVTAPAGSVLLFNGHLWHSGTCNRSRVHRRVLQCSFRGGELTPGLQPAST